MIIDTDAPVTEKEACAILQITRRKYLKAVSARRLSASSAIRYSMPCNEHYHNFFDLVLYRAIDTLKYSPENYSTELPYLNMMVDEISRHVDLFGELPDISMLERNFSKEDGSTVESWSRVRDHTHNDKSLIHVLINSAIWVTARYLEVLFHHERDDVVRPEKYDQAGGL